MTFLYYFIISPLSFLKYFNDLLCDMLLKNAYCLVSRCYYVMLCVHYQFQPMALFLSTIVLVGS